MKIPDPKYSYRISDKMYVVQFGEIRGTVIPKYTQVFLSFFKGGKGRYGAWSPFVDWGNK